MLATLIALYPVLKGLCLGVLSFRAFAFQVEILKGDNNRTSFLAGLQHVVMAAILLETFAFVFPLSAGVYSTASLILSGIPLIAAFAAGSYAQFKKNPYLKLFTDVLDNLLAKIPPDIVTFTNKYAVGFHQWIGTVYFAAQVALFSIIAVTLNPALGFTGLGYFGMSALRANNYLPGFIDKALEEVEHWVGLFAGLIQSNVILKATAIFSITLVSFQNIVLPRLLKKYLGKDSEFLQVSDLVEIEKVEDKISKEVKKDTFIELFRKLPSPLLLLKKNKPGDEALQKETMLFIENTLKSLKLKVTGAFNLPTETFNDKIMYFPRLAVALFSKGKEVFFSVNDSLNNAAKTQAFSTTIKHMAYTPPRLIADAPEIDFVAFKKDIKRNIRRDNNPSYRSMCLESDKFLAIDQELKANLTNFRDKKNKFYSDRAQGVKNKDSLEEINAEIKKINEKIIIKWRKKLNLPEDVQEEEIFCSYIEYRLNDVFSKIETGKGMMWDKSKGSFNEFQQIGKHLISHCQNLFQSNDNEKNREAQSILAVLAIDAGDYCANAAYTVANELYTQYVYPVLAEGNLDKLSPKEKLALYLQQQRQALFENIYSIAVASPLLSHLDLQDRHVHSQIMSQVGVLNLSGKSNAKSDLSNNRGNFVAELYSKFLAYIGARLLLVLDNGYSPEHIINAMKEDAHGGGLSTFDVDECAQAWVNSFQDEDLRNLLNDILISDISDEDLQKLKGPFPQKLAESSAEWIAHVKALSEKEKLECQKEMADLNIDPNSKVYQLELDKKIALKKFWRESEPAWKKNNEEKMSGFRELMKLKEKWSEELRIQLYTMMLYDYGVIEPTDDEQQKSVSEMLLKIKSGETLNHDNDNEHGHDLNLNYKPSLFSASRSGSNALPPESDDSLKKEVELDPLQPSVQRTDTKKKSS
jgi:hypothetical protein